MNTRLHFKPSCLSVCGLAATLLLGGLADAKDEIARVDLSFYDAILAHNGAVHFLERSGCSYEFAQSLAGTAPYNVTIGGNLAAAAQFSFTSPSVDVYQKTNGVWAISQTLTVNNGATSSFGAGLATADGAIVVSDPAHKTGGVTTGAVHVFVPVAGVWTEVQTLTPSTSSNLPFFGNSLDFDGRTLVVGADGDGRAFVYDWSEPVFVESQILAASADGQFAFDVAVEDDVIAVGNINNGSGSGRVHIFERQAGTWTEAGAYEGSLASSYSKMGWSVAVANDRVYSTVQTSTEIAPTYTFEKVNGAWTQTEVTMSNSGSQANIAASSDTLMIAQSIKDGVTTPEEYAVFANAFFAEYGAGCAGTGGFVPTLRGCGYPGSNNSVSLEVSKGLGGAAGLLVLGLDEANPSIGVKCSALVVPIGLFVPFTLSGVNPGEGEFTFTAVVPNVPSAGTVRCQAFLQDATPLGFTSTNGLRFLVFGS